MPGKNSFIFYYEWGESFALLSPVEQAQLLASILEYHRTGKAPALEGAVKMAFSFIKATLDRDRQKWEHVKEARTQAGRKGGIASGKSRKQNQAKEANALFAKQKEANEAVNVNGNVNVLHIPPISPKGDCAYSEAFLTFWEAYPKKTAKGAAFKAFEKLNPDSALLDTFLSALREQKNSTDWKRDGGQYIPHPSTWLNQRRWEDEPKTQSDDGWEYLPTLEGDELP